jgi:hypothetical protein
VTDPQQPVTPAPHPPSAATAPPVAPYSGPYAAPYVAPVHPQYAAAITSPARRSNTLGIVAVIAAGLAALTPITAALAAARIGAGTAAQLAGLPLRSDLDLHILTPVRDWVLLGELSFWAGTALGIWALVQGIVAIARKRGRVAGVVAVVVAVLAPVVFALAAFLAFSAGVQTAGYSGV